MEKPTEEEYFIPLQDQRVFGAGIKRKRIAFIPAATDPTPPSPPQHALNHPTAVSDRYLSIVLQNANPLRPTSLLSTTKDVSTNTDTDTDTTQTIASNDLPPAPPPPQTCPICQLPISLPSLPSSSSPLTNKTPHSASLAHQVCLTHSHPPSHIDRTRPGLKYLSSYGWDPDSRRGLGATGGGGGIRVPLKGKVKNDTVGLGVRVKERGRGKKKSGEEERMVVVGRLDAKQTRRMEEGGRRNAERLREMFYRSEDVERYLGGGGA